jgi:hypothetical protein
MVSMKPLAWSSDFDCVTIAYTPELASRQPEIQEAVNAWIDTPCRVSCFGAPVERVLGESGPELRTLHIEPLQGGGGAQTQTALTYDESKGEIRRARLEIQADLDAAQFRRALLRGLGRALGFDTPAATISSVLHPRSDDGLTAPTDADLRAFCGKYGMCVLAVRE